MRVTIRAMIGLRLCTRRDSAVALPLSGVSNAMRREVMKIADTLGSVAEPRLLCRFRPGFNLETVGPNDSSRSRAARGVARLAPSRIDCGCLSHGGAVQPRGPPDSRWK
jgi:hypothetical protein